MIEAVSAKVLVNASGLNSLPSGPVIANTGRKLMTVVATPVSTASPPRRWRGRPPPAGLSAGSARSRWRRMFSHHDDPDVHHRADGDGDPREGDNVGVDAESFMAMKIDQHGQRQQAGDQQGASQVHDHHEDDHDRR